MLSRLATLLIVLVGCVAAMAQEHTRPGVVPTPRPTPFSRPTPVPTPAPDPQGWVTFNSEPGQFSVLMPEIPTDKEETVNSEHGPYTTHMFTVRSTKSVFFIAWVDYDPAFKFDPTLELEANRDNFVKGIQGTLLSSQNIRFDGYQTLEFAVETPSHVFRSRVYMVGRRPYLLVAGTPKTADDYFNVKRFFDSLKFKSR